MTPAGIPNDVNAVVLAVTLILVFAKLLTTDTCQSVDT